MKKTVLFSSLFLLSFLIAIPQAFAHRGDAPKVFFAKKISYTYLPDDAVDKITVDAIDINGEGLFVPSGTNTTTVTIGGTSLQILGVGALPGRGQQMIVSYPANVLSGSHLLRISNYPAKSQTAYFEFAVGAIGRQGTPGADSTVAGPRGLTGADSVVPGPRGLAGAASTVAGPKGADSTVPGPRGLTGATGPAGNTSTKAWVNFNGRTRNPSIRSNSGIASVARVSTGEYRINFTTPFANNGYVMTGSASGGLVSVKTVTTSSITINLKTSAGRAINGEYIMLQFTSN